VVAEEPLEQGGALGFEHATHHLGAVVLPPIA
jgi:hypothetical protein